MTAQHRDKVVGYVDHGVEEGATLVADGRGLSISGHENGFFIGPTLFDNVTTEMKIYQDEVFGPVLCHARVESSSNANGRPVTSSTRGSMTHLTLARTWTAQRV